MREALNQLEREHLIAIVPRVGTYGRKATAGEVLDAQFHPKLLLNEFRVPYQRLVSPTLSQPARLRRMLGEHRRIVAAIEAHDPAEAERAMRARVRAGREERLWVHLIDRSGEPGSSGGPVGRRRRPAVRGDARR